MRLFLASALVLVGCNDRASGGDDAGGARDGGTIDAGADSGSADDGGRGADGGHDGGGVADDGGPLCVPGGCDDGNVCTEDSCDPAMGCSYVENTSPCDDGNVCTVGDLCGGGTCQNGTNVCECEATADCALMEDGDACNGTLICDLSTHTCEVNAVTVVTCDPAGDTVCAANQCDPTTGTCALLPVNEGGACVDGDGCTGADTCSSGACVGTIELCCSGGTDDDADSATDCDDSDCSFDAGCFPLTIGGCNLESPTSRNGELPGSMHTIYGRVFVAGVTDATMGPDSDPRLVVELGVGRAGTDPAVAGWTWQSATVNAAFTDANDDEYRSRLTVPSPLPCDYAYVFRASGDGGSTWTYCDSNGSIDGYQTANEGHLLVGGAGPPFISEYVEGSGNNAALEITHPSCLGNYVLTGCELQRFNNGSRTGAVHFLTALDLGPGDSWVICNPGIDATAAARCDALDAFVSHDGDDAYVLSCAWGVLDVFGQVGVDPGMEWSGGGVGTADETLRRRCSVVTGDDDASDAFDPSIEWSTFPTDTFDGLGSHCD